MADNTQLNAGTGGDLIATDDIAGVKHQRVKIQYGVDGSATDVSDTNPLPVDDAGGSLTVDNNGTFPVQVSAALPAGDNNIGNVDIVSLPSLPAGANNIGSVNLASPLPAGDNNIGKVDLASSIPAGTNNIGDVDVVSLPPLPAGTNNIGDVDVLSITPGVGAMNLGKSEDAAHSSGDVGVMALGVRDDSPAAFSGTDGDYEPVHVSAEGAVWTTPTPSAQGGCSIFRSLDLDETEEEVKGTAGTVYGMWATNLSTTTRWVKFYNATAASVTVGTTTPVLTIGLPGNSSDDISGVFQVGGMGIAFDTAITVACTTGPEDNDTDPPATGDVVVNIFYK